MTDREAKWVALERVRESMHIEFTFEFLGDALGLTFSANLVSFWCVGIWFEVVDFDFQRRRVTAKRIGGRPFTEGEAIDGYLEMRS